MGIYAVKPAFQRSLTGVRDRLIRSRVSANALTWTALFVSIGGGMALALSDRSVWLLFVVPVLAVVRLGLNALDGMVASATHTSTSTGEVLNELSDRMADVAWIVGLGFIVGFPLALGALGAVLLSSYAGMLGKAVGGRRLYGGVMAKADRMIVLALAAPIAAYAGDRVLEWATWLIGIGAFVTLVERVMTIYRELHAKKPA